MKSRLESFFSSSQSSNITIVIMKNIAIASLFVASTSAFPWVVNQPGVDSSLLGQKVRRQQPGNFQKGGAATCPFNSDHKGAAPYDSKYPYNGAQNGAPGKGIGGYQVPAPGDTAHEYVAPGPNDIRGPCPGLNAAANHNVSLSCPLHEVLADFCSSFLTMVSLHSTNL